MKKLLLYFITFYILFLTYHLKAQEQYQFTVTTLNNPAPGYLRFDWPIKPGFSEVDNYGYFVNEQQVNMGSHYFWQLKNGLIAQWHYNLYYLYDKEMNLVDSINNSTSYVLDYHDFISLSNGHYLMLCIESVTMDLSEIVVGGKTDATIFSNVLVETDRNGVIYWEWKALDHFAITDITNDFDLTLPEIDFSHINSMDVDANGNLLVSFRHFDEISLIDKSTGNFIWRMGGSSCKNNQFTFSNDAIGGFTGFSHQHTTGFLENGNILLFDNGNQKNSPYSRAVEYSINYMDKSVTKVWEYRNSPDIFSSAMGSAYRLPNGNTLICWSRGMITEVKPDKSIALELTLNENIPMYRAQKLMVGSVYVAKYITGTGDYNYNDSYNNTGVNITINSFSSLSQTYVQKHNYSPHTAHYLDSTFTSILPYRWTFTPDGNNFDISGSININTAGLSDISDPGKVVIYKRNKEASGSFSQLTTSYNSSSGVISAPFTGFGEFVIGNAKLEKPELLTPLNNSVIQVEGTVTWSNVVGAVRYQIQFDKNSSFSQPLINASVTGLEKYNFSGLNHNKIYFWRVRAFNDKDTSNWSAANFFKTNIAAPVLTYPSNNMVGLKLKDTLRWSPVDGADSYHVQTSFNISFNTLSLNTKSIKLNQLELTGVGNNIEYFWRVRAFKGADSSKWSEVYNFTTVIAEPNLTSPVDSAFNIPEKQEFLWSYVYGAEFYHFEISENPSFSENLIQIEKVNNNQIEISTLEFDKTYFWRVKALRSTDSSRWSNVWSFSTQYSPVILLSPEVNKSDINVDAKLSWKEKGPGMLYRLMVSKDYNFDIMIVDSAGISANFFKFTELEPFTNYYWKVMVYDKNAASPWSEVYAFKTGKGFELTPPKLLSPQKGSESLSDVDMVWSKKVNAVRYSLQVSLSKEFVNNKVDLLNLTVPEFNCKGLTENKRYYWRVKAYSLYDSSGWSVIWDFNVISPDKAFRLLAPGNDELQIPVNGRLQWDKTPEIEYYTLQLAVDSEIGSPIIDKNIYNDNFFNYSDLELNTTYFWRVRFVRNGEISDWSDAWSFTTITPVQLDIPKITSHISGMSAVPVSGEISWESVKGANHYQLSLSNMLNFSTVFFKQSSINEPKLKYTDLDYGTLYYLRVSAANDSSKSAWSVPLNFVTELEPPVITNPLNESEKIPVTGAVSWQLENDFYLYHIQIASDSEFNNIADEKSDFDNLYHNYSLAEDTEYFCRVKTYNDTNYSRWSDVVRFKTDKPSSIALQAEDYGMLAVYPNPAGDIINVRCNDSAPEPVLCDIYGRELLRFGGGDSVLSIKEFAAGVYFIKAGSQTKIFIKK